MVDFVERSLDTNSGETIEIYYRNYENKNDRGNITISLESDRQDYTSFAYFTIEEMKTLITQMQEIMEKFENE